MYRNIPKPYLNIIYLTIYTETKVSPPPGKAEKDFLSSADNHFLFAISNGFKVVVAQTVFMIELYCNKDLFSKITYIFFISAGS